MQDLHDWMEEEPENVDLIGLFKKKEIVKHLLLLEWSEEAG